MRPAPPTLIAPSPSVSVKPNCWTPRLLGKALRIHRQVRFCDSRSSAHSPVPIPPVPSLYPSRPVLLNHKCWTPHLFGKAFQVRKRKNLVFTRPRVRTPVPNVANSCCQNRGGALGSPSRSREPRGLGAEAGGALANCSQVASKSPAHLLPGMSKSICRLALQNDLPGKIANPFPMPDRFACDLPQALAHRFANSICQG